MDGADVCAEFGRVGVFGDGDGDLDVVGCAAAFELGFCLECVSVEICGRREDERNGP